MKHVTHWTFFIDGASRSNPGHAGIGIYGTDAEGTCICKKGFYIGKKTNNQAEYLALIVAALLIKKIYALANIVIPLNVTFFSDSLLLVKQMQGFYKIKNKEIQRLVDCFHQEFDAFECCFKHILREKNQKADQLANYGIDHRKHLTKELLERLHAYDISM